MRENPALYAVAEEICHEFGMDYYDPRTGRKSPAPNLCTICGDLCADDGCSTICEDCKHTGAIPAHTDRDTR